MSRFNLCFWCGRVWQSLTDYPKRCPHCKKPIEYLSQMRWREEEEEEVWGPVSEQEQRELDGDVWEP